MRTLIRNVNIVNEGKVFVGSVVISGENIVEVLLNTEEPQFECDHEIKADGCYLLPGIIDEHVHFRDPGLIQKGDITTESMAAAAGGVTSIMDMPNTVPQTTTLETLAQKRALMAEKCLVNYSCYFGATRYNSSLFHQLDPHRVCGIKLFMGSSTGDMYVDNELSLYSIFENAEILIAAHCEDQNEINENIEKYRSLMVDDDLPVSYHSKIRSPEVCLHSSILAIRFAMRFKRRLHIMHISSKTELKLFNSLDLEEKKITAETCAGYLLFSSEDYEEKGSLIKVNPSLKSLTNQSALYHAVNNSKIDTIATDHAPHLLSDKRGGALKAASGMPVIQFSLVALLELVTKGIFTLPLLVEKMCHAPASIYQIHDRGYIRPGYKADLVLVREEEYRTITNHDVLSKCRWTPFNGMKVHWRVLRTFVNGRQVYNGQQVDTSCRGQELYLR